MASMTPQPAAATAADAVRATPPRASDRLATGWRWLRTWGFVAVPLVAIWELVAHRVNVRTVPAASDWYAARDYIARVRREGDVVASAPVWTDPLARMYLARFINLRDAARPDATRYRRALVATIRGGEHPDFAGWREQERQAFGRVTVRTLINPRPATVLYDFVEHARPPEAEVFRIERGDPRPCAWQTGLGVAGGGLGQGALAGPERFGCGEGWNYVGRVVLEDMDHRGRLCLWSHPVVHGTMRTVFRAVPLGATVRGHHAIAYEAERGGDRGETGEPVTLTVRVGDAVVGRDVHRDGEGWKLFQFDTRAFAGTRQDVTFEVGPLSGPGNRHYCFEGDAR
jgi:hypothetical protein